MKQALIGRLLATVAAGPALMLATAQAQDSAAPAPQADAGAGEIIVTARKRDERLIDVPVAVSALSTDQIERYATTSFQAISQQVPQLVIAESQNQVGGSINLRGIGAGISNPSTETAVTLNFDGVPISYGNAIRLGQIDLGRVEVLKGPQALFYGKNSPGGIVSLISQDPGKDFEAKLRTGYEFMADQRFVEASASVPLTDGLAARVVGYYSKEDGWFRNVAEPIAGITPGRGADSLNSEDVFVRGTLAYDAGGSTRIKAKVNYGQRERDGVGPTGLSQIIYCPAGVSRYGSTDCTLNRNFYDAILAPATAASDPSYGDGVPFMKSKQFLASLSIDQDLGDAYTLSSVTGYYRLRERSVDSFTFSNNPYFGASNDITAKGFSQELRLASDYDGPLNFLVGGFFQDAHFLTRQAFTTNFGTPFVVGSTYYDVHTKATSVFGQLRYKIVERLELAVGGRYSWEDKSLTGTSLGSPIQILGPKQNYTDFSPDVTLTWRPDSDRTVYAAYREGFTSGGFNTVPTRLRTDADQSRAAIDLSYDQMTAKGGEIGTKGYVADRQILYDLVGYYYKYSGLQLSRYDNASFTQLTQNAGGAEIKGAELSLTIRPRTLAGLTFNTAIAYNNARYTDFIGGCYAGQSIAQGCNLNPLNPNLPQSTWGTAANPYQNQDQTGQRLFRAPEIAITGGFTYDHGFADRLGGSLSVDFNYSSAYVTQTEGNPRTLQDDYVQLNAALSINGGAGKPWELSLIGRNLTNKLIIVGGSVVGASAAGTGTNAVREGDILGSLGAPRAVMLQLTVKSGLLGGR
ncbi:MAG: TonB-dependent receptor [Sphingobium yanoikuyae]|uniref:TonB-dependent receptor n=1 Tax=Sphingobium yanoikuyae TaxID=13690 RepID=A0A9X7YBR2_SPHYA|nr:MULTISPECIES: TonB-dependent receptor [Sphingobium]MBO9525905.1 TonB-dependent receptor [Sphingobium yanoikuyae]PZU68225.1 MAG: TonB-dependent receptor [Sphingobium sp.]QNG44815.1 TonB-dependent receptor [Sphingobium yanoikuyae]